MTEDQLDALLGELADGLEHSRDSLCNIFHIRMEELFDRVWALQKRGYEILSKGGHYFTLLPKADSFLPVYIRWQLTTQHFGRGTIFYAPEMDSTNTELKQMAAARALPEGTLAVCDRQTAGRGRMQRQWVDPVAGESLTCSLLLRPRLPPEAVSLVTLATAVAAAETIAEWGLDAGIKWPNDVVLGERKCVGILCETVTDPAGERCVVVGAGFNLNQKAFAGELNDRATSLRIAWGEAVDRRTFLSRYLFQMERAMDALESKGFAGIRPAYEARSVTLGRQVTVIGAGESFVGTAEHIDGDGALNVRDAAGNLRRVLSGDVSVRGVMGYV
jgi:BirA family biotin operon repressor/biotin-[acetyl-CoA-carboxylase] ligase